MDASKFKPIVPIFLAMVVTAVFGLGVIFFTQTYSGYQHQKAALEQTRTRVRLARTQQNELILKQRLLNQTKQFVNAAHSVGLSPSKWTVYDINLQETVGFDKADQILKQCADSRVAYFQPISLQVKVTPKEVQGNNTPMAEKKGDVTLSVQGKFLARQP